MTEYLNGFIEISEKLAEVDRRIQNNVVNEDVVVSQQTFVARSKPNLRNKNNNNNNGRKFKCFNCGKHRRFAINCKSTTIHGHEF